MWHTIHQSISHWCRIDIYGHGHMANYCARKKQNMYTSLLTNSILMNCKYFILRQNVDWRKERRWKDKIETKKKHELLKCRRFVDVRDSIAPPVRYIYDVLLRLLWRINNNNNTAPKRKEKKMSIWTGIRIIENDCTFFDLCNLRNGISFITLLF